MSSSRAKGLILLLCYFITNNRTTTRYIWILDTYVLFYDSHCIISIKSFRPHYKPEVDTLCNRNEYQEYFLGGKGGRCVRLINFEYNKPTRLQYVCGIGHGPYWRRTRLTTLPPSCAVVMKSINLNFLEPSGPVQACNGTDLYVKRKKDGVWFRPAQRRDMSETSEDFEWSESHRENVITETYTRY